MRLPIAPSNAQAKHDDASLSPMIARDGYVFLKKWYPDVPSEEIVGQVGQPLKFGKYAAVHRITPQREAAPNTYSGIYGLNDFPYHSDMAHWRDPPHYLMLRCIKGHALVGTLFVDGREVIEHAGRENLVRALIKPRRPLNGSLSLFPLLRPEREGRPSLLRWDEKFIVPASRAGEEGIKLVRTALGAVTRMSIFLCESGDTLFLDNWRMLHGRSAVPPEHANRILERCYLGALH